MANESRTPREDIAPSMWGQGIVAESPPRAWLRLRASPPLGSCVPLFFSVFSRLFFRLFYAEKNRPGQFLSRVILFFAPPGFFRTNFGPGTPSARKKIRACCGKFHPVGHVSPDFFVLPGKCKPPRAKIFPRINVPTPQAPGEGIACLAVDLHRKNEPE